MRLRLCDKSDMHRTEARKVNLLITGALGQVKGNSLQSPHVQAWLGGSASLKLGSLMCLQSCDN